MTVKVTFLIAWKQTLEDAGIPITLESLEQYRNTEYVEEFTGEGQTEKEAEGEVYRMLFQDGWTHSDSISGWVTEDH